MSENDNNALIRLDALRNHLEIKTINKNSKEWRTLSQSQSLIVCMNRDRKWNGYGYKDTFFKFTEQGTVILSGNRYSNFSSKEFHELRPWLEQTLRINLKTLCQAQPSIIEISSPEVNHEFYNSIKPQGIWISFAEQDRLSHGHGVSTNEIYKLRYKNLSKIPDAVIWPENHDQVELIILAAQKYDVGCIPFGGGSNEVNALEFPLENNKKRMIVSLDMRNMNKILSLNTEDITIGGLASLRSGDFNGHKGNINKNFEENIVNIKMVTPAGIIQRSNLITPPVSSGPDITNLLLGSEGSLGVITELTFKLQFSSPHHRYISLYFSSFQNGLEFLREIVQKKVIQNYSGIHLVDELGLQLIQAFSTVTPNVTNIFFDSIKKFYLKRWKGLKVGKMCLAALILENNDLSKLDMDEKNIQKIATNYKGIMAGSELSETMFFSSKILPYFRDFLLDYYAISNFLDTSTPWSNIKELIIKVKERIISICKEQGVKTRPYIGVRVAQVYETGVGLTFIYGFNCHNLDDPLETLRCVEKDALTEILKSNGSISQGISGIVRYDINRSGDLENCYYWNPHSPTQKVKKIHKHSGRTQEVKKRSSTKLRSKGEVR
ncbi:4944_t:CDS:2 [Diversispora eburnea]|uniref:Alkylglycerone-phosphate synthase n=1 Tax=Diversispora eburnea TaxID=1213867 RepID=A0A9N8Z6J7_9GLOM|nr:4944_t:CDS:2 [Diversispora eburnea]